MIYRLENQLSICQMRRKRGRCKCLCDSAFFLLWVWLCYHPSMDILFGKEFPSLISKYFSAQSPGVHLTLKTDMCCRWRRSAFIRSRNLRAIGFLCSCGQWVLNAKHKFWKKRKQFFGKIKHILMKLSMHIFIHLFCPVSNFFHSKIFLFS